MGILLSSWPKIIILKSGGAGPEIGFWALQVVSAVPETTDDFLPGVDS